MARMKLSIPDPTAQAHSDILSEAIRNEITQAGGSISFARFMELALYAPGLGYYSAGQRKIGKEGDFVTAPEISPLFSHCVARQCKQILSVLKKGDILEIGAGTGVFAKDILLELEALNSLPEYYFILEVSAELRARQEELLGSHCLHLLDRIIWLDSLPETAINGIIIANEVMDALPVHCFKIKNHAIQERCVIWDKDHFNWLLTAPTAPALLQRGTMLLQDYALADDYESEINLLLPTWIQSIASILNKGIILLFDYGYSRREYYHAERKKGTLICYHQHRRHEDPFKLIGFQDITAHVEFTTLVESAYAVGCILLGYSVQAHFLLNCGLLELAQTIESAGVAHMRQAQAIKKLLLPSQMGELIKVMALGKNYTHPLCGFPLPDRRRDL
ncbi:MAG: hypothetical protein K0S27_380 [Gammaproteobacteria bacterium]|jgi:SAM-dependent MidA family methyltransferase|nr:hypothetical protein [Gammaproteobacteria bacterium]